MLEGFEPAAALRDLHAFMMDSEHDFTAEICAALVSLASASSALLAAADHLCDAAAQAKSTEMGATI